MAITCCGPVARPRGTPQGITHPGYAAGERANMIMRPRARREQLAAAAFERFRGGSLVGADNNRGGAMKDANNAISVSRPYLTR